MILKMITFVSSRFTNSSWQENDNYRIKHGLIGCIYGSSQEMSPKILPSSIVFVVEMNNDKNQIEGIGLISNKPYLDTYYKIYSHVDYNRYIYRGNYHINREMLIRYNPMLVAALDYILFKEKTHSKRGAGFITIPDQRFLHEKCNNINIKDEIKRIFIDAFGKNDKLCATNLIDRIKKV